MTAPVEPKGWLRAGLDGLYAWTGAIAALAIAAIFLLMLAQAIGRELGFSIKGAVELTSWSNAGAAFLGLAYAFKHGDIIRVGLALDRLSGRRRQMAEIVCLVIGTIAAAYAVWAAASYVLQSWRMNELADGLLVVPMWIPQMAMVCGLVVFLIAVVDELVRVLSGHVPSYQVAIAERDRSGEFGADS